MRISSEPQFTISDKVTTQKLELLLALVDGVSPQTQTKSKPLLPVGKLYCNLL